MKIERELNIHGNKSTGLLSADVLGRQDLMNWIPSNLSPLLRVLPEGSRLHIGVPVLDRVMFTFSNTELKPVIMLYGLNGYPTYMRNIHRRIAPILPDSWNSRPQPYNIARIVRTFMSPTGFAQEPIRYHFATTPQGELAKDSAAFLLRKAVDLGIPLGPILQERTEDKENPTRAYITRIAALMALREGALSQVRLHKRMGGDLGVLAWNLRVLSERKLILYEAVDTQVKGQYTYQRADMSRVLPEAGALARNIIKYFELNEVGNHYAIAQALGVKDIHYIGKTLRQLARAGVLKPVKWEAIDRQSDAGVTTLGKRFIDEVIVPLLAAYASNKQGLRMLAEARTELEQNHGIATEALDQYKRQRILTPESETQQSILAFIRQNGSQRRRQILSRIGKNAHPQLIELVANGYLRTVRDGNASFYVLPETNEHPTRSEEVILFEFSPPADLIKTPEHRRRDEYRRELDTVGFWQRLQRELLQVPADRYTARDFFLKYDPKYRNWALRYYSGIFSNHVRALWSLKIEKPWEFIRTYQPKDASQELQEAIAAAQELINKVLPVEAGPRIFNRKYVDRLEAPKFWRELMAEVQSVPPGTKIESFLLRFDPNVEGKMKLGHQYGKYYPFRNIFKKYFEGGPVALLTTYRPPQDTPIETLLTIREAQAALQRHLAIRDAPEDDFSDIPELQNRLAIQEQERKKLIDRFRELKTYFSRFQNFNEQDLTILTQCDAARIRELERNIRGTDYDEVSFASMGITTMKKEGGEDIPIPFPAEPRAAFIVYLFESWRRGTPLPNIPRDNEDFVLSNGIIRLSLKTMERYLSHYEAELKRQNPQDIFNARILLDYISKYINKFEDGISNREKR